MKARLSRSLPFVAVVLGLLWFAAPFFRRPDPRMARFGRLPVVEQGRIKPLASVARNTLLAVSKRETFRDLQGKVQPPERWLLDQLTHTPRASRYRIIRIEHEGVLGLANLEMRPGSFRYSLDEVLAAEKAINRAMGATRHKPEGQRDLFDRKLLDLVRRVNLLQEFSAHEAFLVAVRAGGEREWLSLAKAIDLKTPSPQATAWRQLLAAWANDDMGGFDAALEVLERSHAVDAPGEVRKAGVEVAFLTADPIYRSMIMYVMAFLLVAFGWLGFSEPLNRAAFWMVVLTLAVHTLALLTRMYMHGRPPVTNLYSSAVFVAWGAVIASLALERMFRGGLGTATGAVVGAASLFVAHHLGADGETMEMMRAVLDTNFWLATHVTVVTLGYSANFLAGVLAAVYVIRGVFTTSLDRGSDKNISRMIYGTIAFATLFSFLGTVLGGIWADQSWGRFWGWDPKENGALMIVLWDVLILHARQAGLVRNRGIAVLALLANVVTAWSWFGVNMLGVGLHSYGFTDGAARALWGFVLGNLVLVAVALLPPGRWRSHAATRGR